MLICAFMSEIMSEKNPWKIDRSELNQYHAIYGLRFRLPPKISNQTQLNIKGDFEMANILISDLQPAGSGLFSDSESFITSMKDLSENELKMTVKTN